MNTNNIWSKNSGVAGGSANTEVKGGVAQLAHDAFADLSASFRYGINSASGFHYLVGIALFVLMGALTLGAISSSPVTALGVLAVGSEPYKIGEEVYWAVFLSMAAMLTYLVGKSVSVIQQAHAKENLTPVFPGLLWLTIGLMTLFVMFSYYGHVQEFIRYEIERGSILPGVDTKEDPLFSLHPYVIGGVVLLETLVLFAAFVHDVRFAFSGLPVNMNVTNNALAGESLPARHVAPVQPAPVREDYPLTTRDTESLKPKLTFDDLAGNEELKEKLFTAAQEWNNGGQKNGKNGILLHGVPGTGKTAFAEALAGEVGLKIMKVNIGSMASRWVNQTTEQLQDIIDSALRQAPCMLFLDEVEAIFPDRGRIERGDSEESKVVGSFLSSVEKLRAGRVLLVAATNYKDRVDAAAIREGRFDFHIEVEVPDFEARKGLIQGELKKAGKTVEPAVLDRLSRRWAGFNVPRVQAAARRGAGFCASNTVGMADFMRGLRDVQGNKTGVPETALALEDLYFDDDLKHRLAKLAATFAQSDEIEARGGSVPKGVAFYGPPGTGKSTMAQALAKASGWTFIPTSGKEILADASKLREISRKASDLRPSIVFIDEADDILGDRSMSGVKTHTNDLLRTIDGAGEPMHDVVWIIATNDVNGLDEAVIRRFPTKIELPIPSVSTTLKLVRDWAAKRPEMIPGGVDAWSAEVAVALEGLAPSVVKGILESALNTEAAESVLRGEEMSITLNEVLEARREMRA